jgi:hypothetical protein
MTDPIITAAEVDASKIATGVTKDAEAGATVASKGLAALVAAHPKTALSVALAALLAIVIGLCVAL